jgi:hypothetical protein
MNLPIDIVCCLRRVAVAKVLNIDFRMSLSLVVVAYWLSGVGC